ncbi:MAG: 3'-5' exonuclease [Flavobacteriaceae bacterium]
MALFKTHHYPDFWKAYEKTFSEKRPASIEETRFVVFDTETTGLDPSKDKLLSIGAVVLHHQKIVVADSFEVFLEQEKFNRETVAVHGILKKGTVLKIPETEAIALFLNYLGNAVLVAHHAAFDVEMINRALRLMKLPKLKNRCIDTSMVYQMLLGKSQKPVSLDTLCKEFTIPMHDRHNALGDAVLTARLFYKLLSKLQNERKVQLQDLYISSLSRGW